MLCPKCKTDNPDNAAVCSSCGQVLQTALVKKTSKLAVTAFVISLCGIFIPPLFAVPALILAIGSIFHIRKRTDKLQGQKLAVTAIVCSVFALVTQGIWGIDAPPIPDDYIMADLHQVPASCRPSYEILMKLAEEPNSPVSATGLTKQEREIFWKIRDSFEYRERGRNDFEIISTRTREHKAEITDLWNKTSPARAIIDELSKFEEIADLTQPYPAADRRIFCFNLVEMARLYKFHAYVQVDDGNDIDAAKELVKFDSVVRKLAANVRSILNFMACYLCLKNDIEAANYIANNSRTSHQALDILAQHYSRTSSEQISPRNAILGEYVLFGKPHIIEIQKAKDGYVVKPNSLLRLKRNACDHWINMTEPSPNSKPPLKVWPSFYPDMPSINYETDELSFWYKLYNPIGSAIISLMKYKNRLIESKTEIEARAGLIRIALNKRLGKEVNLKAPAYSDKYIIDKDKRIIFSPGPDKKAYTVDDIELPYDPNVIKF
jgi:hypothetical protein